MYVAALLCFACAHTLYLNETMDNKISHSIVTGNSCNCVPDEKQYSKAENHKHTCAVEKKTRHEVIDVFNTSRME